MYSFELKIPIPIPLHVFCTAPSSSVCESVLLLAPYALNMIVSVYLLLSVLYHMP
jgi:hypothetical protein